MKKRGLSGVVTTVIIILVALAAVGIIAGYVLPTVKTASKDISAACYNIDISPKSCSLLVNEPSVTIKRGAGDAELERITFIFEELTTGITELEEVNIIEGDAASDIQELQTLTYAVNTLTNIGTVESVKISAVILDEVGDEKICPPSVKRSCVDTLLP